jgi:NTE family protein
MARTAAATPVAIDLALQGGGSHGAFTWGVLDRLLDDATISFDGVSGTSAGALNAAVLATGLAEGGRAGAKQSLAALWQDVAATGRCFGSLARVPDSDDFGAWAANPWGAGLAWWTQHWLRMFAPAQLNPGGFNALRGIVERHVRPAAIAGGPLRLFVTATSVRTGQPRLFTSARELGDPARCTDALLASACLPQLFPTVHVDGEPYWDGGYSGNPALWPLVYETDALDLLLVKINPLARRELPDTAEEIAERVNEITFNSALVGEMRAIAFVQKLFEEGQLDPGRYRRLRLHMIGDEQRLAALGSASKLDTSATFLAELHGLGVQAAERWLLRHRAQLGRESTLDPRKVFLEPRTL